MARKNITLGERIRYAFDTTMAAGPAALIGWLAIFSFLGIVAAAIVLVLTRIRPEGAPPLSFPEAAWQALMHTIDSGDVENDQGWAFRGIGILITFWGIFVVSSLIGLLTTGMQERLGELRKGRSRVLERDHTLILNWSPAVFDIIEQISHAAQDERAHRRVVVLAPNDKVEMEDALAEKGYARVRVICRSGDPTDLRDLAMVNAAEARAIIVVSSPGGDPDARSIKTALALIQAIEDKRTRPRIVAEFRDSANVEAVRAIGGGGLQAVMADDLISRIIVHASRQSGLSTVYSELLDYEGMEFHFAPLAALAGKTFRDALNAYDRAALVGICVGEDVKLNPPMDSMIAPAAQGIFVAQSSSGIRAARTPAAIDTTMINTGSRAAMRAERALILGWNRLGPAVASELSHYMTGASVLTIVSDTPGFADAIERLSVANGDVRVEHIVADPRSRTVIRGLNPAACNHAIVLACDEGVDAETADTHTLVSLMHVRQAIPEDAGVTIVSEILNVHNSAIAQAMRADDLVVSNRLISLMLTQMSENEKLLPIFSEILDEQGAEIYMRPIEDYVRVGAPLSFATIVAAAAARGECAFGYQIAGKGEPGGGVRLNPAKTRAFTPKPGDCVIVMAKERAGAG